MTYNLNNKRVAILATDGFEQSEFTEPRDALKNAGASIDVIAPKSGAIRGWAKGNWGDTFEVDKTVADAKPDDYDALVLPGGVMNPDKLRMNDDAVNFVRAFFEQHKPVAAICHGPQILIDADVVEDRSMTSYPSLRRDLENAGAKWSDEEVIVDQGLVTSRTPKDLPAFCDKMCEEIAEGKHAKQTA